MPALLMNVCVVLRWNCDQNEKLGAWGFKLYLIVDGRSRFILFCGIIHDLSQIEILHPYLDTVERVGYVPTLLVTDHGRETGLMRTAQVRTRVVPVGQRRLFGCHMLLRLRVADFFAVRPEPH